MHNPFEEDIYYKSPSIVEIRKVILKAILSQIISRWL
jgi:hypothetical protein